MGGGRTPGGQLELIAARDDEPGRLGGCEWRHLSRRLRASRFRSGFRLAAPERRYLDSRGYAAVRAHAREFVARRLAPAAPPRDGRQTPWRGHPVFVAQHATATCCRRCLERWHAIPAGRRLEAAEIAWIVAAIMAWLGDVDPD